MTHDAAAKAAALAVFLAGAACSSLVLAKPPERCPEVRVELDQAGHKVLVELKNACEARVGCTISWNLRCGHGRSETRTEKVWVDGRGDQRIEASAVSCGDDDWAISPPRWRCDDIHATTTSSTPRRGR